MNDKNKAPFKVEDVNWDELSGIAQLQRLTSHNHL